MLANADCVLFLVTGEDKADAVKRAFEGPESDDTPASRIRSGYAGMIAASTCAAASLSWLLLDRVPLIDTPVYPRRGATC